MGSASCSSWRAVDWWVGWVHIRQQSSWSQCWYLRSPISSAWWGVMSATETPLPFWNFPLWKILSHFHVVPIWILQHPIAFCRFTLSPDADDNLRQLWKNICISACSPRWTSKLYQIYPLARKICLFSLCALYCLFFCFWWKQNTSDIDLGSPWTPWSLVVLNLELFTSQLF